MNRAWKSPVFVNYASRARLPVGDCQKRFDRWSIWPM